MKFYVGYSGIEDSNGHSCFIHKAGCRDIARNRQDVEREIEGTLQDAIDSHLDEEMKEMGYDESLFKIFPCARI